MDSQERTKNNKATLLTSFFQVDLKREKLTIYLIVKKRIYYLNVRNAKLCMILSLEFIEFSSEHHMYTSCHKISWTNLPWFSTITICLYILA